MMDVFVTDMPAALAALSIVRLCSQLARLSLTEDCSLGTCGHPFNPQVVKRLIFADAHP